MGGERGGAGRSGGSGEAWRERGGEERGEELGEGEAMEGRDAEGPYLPSATERRTREVTAQSWHLGWCRGCQPCNTSGVRTGVVSEAW